MDKITLEYLSGLGFVAKNKRVIKPLGKYYNLIPKPDSITTQVKDDGSVTDTVDYCKKIVKETLPDTKRLAPLLRGNTIEETCRNVFSFIYDHIQYEEDKPGVEQVRRPSRTLHDSKGDCDCMSILASSILTNLGIPHSFRIVKMYGRNWFQHIYVVVPRQSKGQINPDLSIRYNYIVIDPVLDKFNQEAPKINFKKDFKMENLGGIPIEYLHGPQGVDNSLLGNEFEGLENFNGTEAQLNDEWHRRMKQHLINTHSYVTKNPGRVSHIYQPTAYANALKGLIDVWDSETAREGKLDSLSANEESLLQPHLQGLGDIIGGPDDNLFGLINADLNGDLGKAAKKSSKPVTKKAVARKAAKAASKPVKKRGHFTKIKQASKNVKSSVKKSGQRAGSNIKHAAKKTGHAVVKGSTTPIRVGMLLAMKTNFGKIASRLYWGLFSKEEAMQHGILPDYWQAANSSWNHTRGIFVNALKGDEKALRKSIITGKASKVAKRGTHGLGSTNSELFTNGLGVVTEASITAASAVLGPLLALINKNFKGKKATASAPVDNGSASADDSGDNEPVTQTQADHVEDNYNNEVVETPPAQEPEADGSVQESEDNSTDDSNNDDGSTDGLGKVIKSKKGTIVHKRILNAKQNRAAAKPAKKEKGYTTPLSKNEIAILLRAGQRKGIDPKVLNQMKPNDAKKLISEQRKYELTHKFSKNAKVQKHIADANALKHLPADQLIAKIKANPKLKHLTHAQVVAAANKIKNKTTAQITSEANAVAVNLPEDNVTEYQKPIVVNNPNKTFAENAQEGADNAKVNSEADPTNTIKKEISENAQEIADKAKDDQVVEPTGLKDAKGRDIYKSGPEGIEPYGHPKESKKGHWEEAVLKGFAGKGDNGYVWIEDSGNGGKIVLGLAAAAGLALILMSKKKKKEPVHGLGTFKKGSHHKNVYELNKEADKIKKMLKKKGEKLTHGYTVKNRKKTAKARVLKIK